MKKPGRITVLYDGYPCWDFEKELKAKFEELGYVGPDTGYGLGERDMEFFTQEWLDEQKEE